VTELDLPLLSSGKVRRLYELPDDPATGEGRLLMVATDNISAFDFILDSQIPHKGEVLNQLSVWWFGQLGNLVPNHLISTDVPDAVRGRAMVVEKLAMIPVECVVRGYLTGSGWAEYQESQTACGVPLPEGLHDGSKLDSPIFTPAMKAPQGEHDENVTFEQMSDSIGFALSEVLRDLSLKVYETAADIAASKGLILADTKFEFGQREDGTIVLADEVLTPDSSRYWDAAAWAKGDLSSFDKQYVRDWLSKDSGWDRRSDTQPPALPASVIKATTARYLEAYERLTGSPMAI
jgi:phosphoribosylaminoimidazole-succinocarboxamide synthase